MYLRIIDDYQNNPTLKENRTGGSRHEKKKKKIQIEVEPTVKTANQDSPYVRPGGSHLVCLPTGIGCLVVGMRLHEECT